MTEQASKNVYQRLNEIRKAVAYIKKDKQVDKYKAVTHDAVTAETRDHFIEHGVMVVPSEISSATVLTGSVTSSGRPYIRFEALYEIRFVNIDEPDQFVAVRMTSHAEDTGDKAPGKALSYAVKYAELKVLNIETGENDEARETVSGKKEPLSAVEVSGWIAMIENAPADQKKQRYAEAMQACSEREDTNAYSAIKAKFAQPKKEAAK